MLDSIAANTACDRTDASRAALATCAEIVRRKPLPIIADIHFDYRWALAAIDAGFDAFAGNRLEGLGLYGLQTARLGALDGDRVHDLLGDDLLDAGAKFANVLPPPMIGDARPHLACLVQCFFTELDIGFRKFQRHFADRDRSEVDDGFAAKVAFSGPAANRPMDDVPPRTFFELPRQPYLAGIVCGRSRRVNVDQELGAAIARQPGRTRAMVQRARPP